MSIRWDRHFLQLALDHARMSKDPSTKVGAVIVGSDKEILSVGFNGFPRGILDTPERLNDREMKLRLTVHAERNALLSACRTGIPLKGTTMYIAAQDAVTADIWGGPPCTHCAIELIQAGITKVVSFPLRTAPSRWTDDLAFSLGILTEARIAFREIHRYEPR